MKFREAEQCWRSKKHLHCGHLRLPSCKLQLWWQGWTRDMAHSCGRPSGWGFLCQHKSSDVYICAWSSLFNDYLKRKKKLILLYNGNLLLNSTEQKQVSSSVCVCMCVCVCVKVRLLICWGLGQDRFYFIYKLKNTILVPAWKHQVLWVENQSRCEKCCVKEGEKNGNWSMFKKILLLDSETYWGKTWIKRSWDFPGFSCQGTAVVYGTLTGQ